MRRHWFGITVAVVCIVAVLLLVQFGLKVCWVGGFPLRVALTISTPSPIQRMSYCLMRSQEEVDWLASNGFKHDEWSFKPVGWIDGRSFEVDVKTSGSTDGLGFPLSYAQMRFIVLRIEFEDGTKLCKTAEIPDGREVRSLEITIP